MGRNCPKKFKIVETYWNIGALSDEIINLLRFNCFQRKKAFSELKKQTPVLGELDQCKNCAFEINNSQKLLKMK
jgi:hypothetical protein